MSFLLSVETEDLKQLSTPEGTPLVATPVAGPSNSPALSVANWFVAPVTGNDGNDGLTAATAVRTVMGGIVPKWGSRVVELPQLTAIRFLEDETSGQENIDLAVTGVGLQILGEYVPVGAATTLSAVTPKATPAQLLEVQLTALPAGVQPGWYVHNLTRGSRATIKTVSLGTLTMDQVLTAQTLGSVALPSEDDGWAVTDAVQVERPLAVNLSRYSVNTTATFGPLLQAIGVIGDSCTVYDSNFVIPVDVCCFANTKILNSDCEFINLYVDDSVGLTFSGVGPSGFGSFFLGGYAAFLTAFNAQLTIDFDAILGVGPSGSGANTRFAIGKIFIPTKGNFTLPEGSVMFCSAGAFSGDVLLWGDGFLGVLGPNARVALSGAGLTFAATFLFTGGIEGFLGLTSSGSFDVATGAWTAGVAPTNANLDANGNVQSFQSGCSVYHA